MDAKRYLVVALIGMLFAFYYTYFRVTLAARRRLEPFAKAIKNLVF